MITISILANVLFYLYTLFTRQQRWHFILKKKFISLVNENIPMLILYYAQVDARLETFMLASSIWNPTMLAGNLDLTRILALARSPA